VINEETKMKNSNKPAKKIIGWRFPTDLIEIVQNIAERDGRYVERVAADALRAGLAQAEGERRAKVGE